MKKLTFGVPEKNVPTKFCDGLNYTETAVSYPTDKIEFYENSRGCCLRFPLGKDEHVYGGGLQTVLFDLVGKKLTLRTNADCEVKTGDSHAPVPFLVSTAGYGIYIDTARYAEIYIGSSPLLLHEVGKTDDSLGTSTDELYNNEGAGGNISVQIPSAKGVDVYIFEGKTITDIVAEYNRFSGGGCDVPEWGLMPFFRMYVEYRDSEVLEKARSFIDKKLPIGVIGLEPGWHSHAYSCTFKWRTETLYPDYEKMLKELFGMGYHLNLWEHCFVHPDCDFYRDILPYCGDYRVFGGAVPDFADENAVKIFSEHHRDKLISLGIDGFKLDECDGSDFTGSWSFPNMAAFPSGLDGEQYHSLLGTLYARTLLRALEGKPTMSLIRSAGALAAPYPFVLYSDLSDFSEYIRALCNSGFSGLLWTPEVRYSFGADEYVRRLQTAVFSVMCNMNGWNDPRIPWENHGCENEVRELLNERVKLIPMLKKAFMRYRTEGVAPARALVSDYTNDAETYKTDDEYLLGDSLLVAPIAPGEKGREVYLPEGNWIDYHTRERVRCGRFEVETANIPVFEKAGD
ncbi:MAG: glycoside hydrolase [Clostridiales bacterium]|nr:glycoside hydrolase [Clostridiales bacterium]